MSSSTGKAEKDVDGRDKPGSPGSMPVRRIHELRPDLCGDHKVSLSVIFDWHA
jgi:hypothetical protein